MSDDSDNSLETGSHMSNMSSSDDWDDSLASDEEMFEEEIIGGRQLNILFQNAEDEEHFSGITRQHYNNAVIPLKEADIDSLFYSFHSQLSDDGKRQIGVLLAENSLMGSIKQMNITFSEEQPQLGAVFRGPFTQGHALRRFKIGSDDDLYSVIKL